MHPRRRVGPSHDHHERAADRVAGRVAGGAAPPSAAGRHDPGGPVDAGTERAIRRARGGGRALPGRWRGPMERAVGADLGTVRLHTGAVADRLSRSLGAEAFTTGADIFFRRGGYAPDTATGRHVLAHELAHVAQQRSAAAGPGPTADPAPPPIQRYIASVNHPLRDPKAEPKDDYGTYRSLDVALAADRGGSGIHKGANTATKGGTFDDLSKGETEVELRRDENLYLVGHGMRGYIGNKGPATVAGAIDNIAPADWRGTIYSLNCWSAFKGEGTPSSGLELLTKALGEKGRPGIRAVGPAGVSIRHRSWLGEADTTLGVKAVVASLGDEEKTFKQVVKEAHEAVGIKDPEKDFDAALRGTFSEDIGLGQPIGVERKADFATGWGRKFQVQVVDMLHEDARLKDAIGTRVIFPPDGHVEVTFGAPEQRELVDAVREVVTSPTGPVVEDHPVEVRVSPSVTRSLEEHTPDRRPEPRVPTVPTTEPRPPDPRPWTWLEIAGIGAVAVTVVTAGVLLVRHLTNR